MWRYVCHLLTFPSGGLAESCKCLWLLCSFPMKTDAEQGRVATTAQCCGTSAELEGASGHTQPPKLTFVYRALT